MKIVSIRIRISFYICYSLIQSFHKYLLSTYSICWALIICYQISAPKTQIAELFCLMVTVNLVPKTQTSRYHSPS